MYSSTICRAVGGRCGDASMRLIVIAERPDALWRLLSTVQALLLDNPRTAACFESVSNPAETKAWRISAIFEACLAFLSGTVERLGSSSLIGL
jgi:hypothetical protein